MANSIAWVLAEYTKAVIQEAQYISLSAYEVTATGEESWLSIYLYVCLGFKCVSILLALVYLVDGNGANALKETMHSQLCFHIGLGEKQVEERLVYFGVDSMPMMQEWSHSPIVRVCSSIYVWNSLHGTSDQPYDWAFLGFVPSGKNRIFMPSTLCLF
jgi:hypothetical protein